MNAITLNRQDVEPAMTVDTAKEDGYKLPGKIKAYLDSLSRACESFGGDPADPYAAAR